jgi:hypothetical protein
MWPERILGPFQGGDRQRKPMFQSELRFQPPTKQRLTDRRINQAYVARVEDRNYTSGDLYERCAPYKRFVQEYPEKLTAVPTAVPTAACMWCGREFDPGLVDAHEEQCGN